MVEEKVRIPNKRGDFVREGLSLSVSGAGGVPRPQVGIGGRWVAAMPEKTI